MDKKRIYVQKHGTLKDDDWLVLVQLLAKAGYIVRIGREQKPNKTTTVKFIEYWEA